MDNQPIEPWRGVEKPKESKEYEACGRGLSAAAPARKLTEQAADGYLELLDSNNTCLDYDTEIDERWLDLDFGERLRARHRTARRRQGRGNPAAMRRES